MKLYFELFVRLKIVIIICINFQPNTSFARYNEKRDFKEILYPLYLKNKFFERSDIIISKII